MQTHAFLASLSLLLSLSLQPGCAGSPGRPAARTDPAARTAPAAPAPAPAPAADPHDRAVGQLVGVWSGTALDTPLGDFPLAIAFDREPGGDVHGRIDDGRGTYLDFRFRKDGGRWLLVEEGAISGLGMQTETLAPAADTGPPRWVAGAPAHLVVELAVDAEQLVMTTTLRGEPHAVFRMRRAHGEAAEQLRQAIARGPRPAAE